MDCGAKQTLSVTCPKCHARYTVHPRAAGKRIACPGCHAQIQIPLVTCPDCGAKTQVPAPVPSRLLKTREEIEADAYELDESAAPGTRPPVVLLAQHERVYESPDSGRRIRTADAALQPRPVPPRWPLVRGVFSFPLQPGVAIRSGALGAWLAIELTIFYGAMHYILAGYAAFIGVCLLGVTLILGLILFAATSACWLTVLEDSADGIDCITGWPDAMFIDWMLHGFYVLMAIALATVPGWAVAMFTLLDGPKTAFSAALMFFICFPFALLSMLEIDSPWAPFSPRLFKSLFWAPVAWFFFYSESLLLVAVLAFGIFWVFHINPWLLLPVAPIVVACTFIYFRLLGRLGWCLAQPVPAA